MGPSLRGRSVTTDAAILQGKSRLLRRLRLLAMTGDDGAVRFGPSTGAP